jgi:hypothetical protein
MGTFEVDFEPPRPHAVGDSVKYRLDVIGSTAVDVVGSIGGWLCDRARAGWDVHVMLAQECDQRPLEILGMRVTSLDTRAPLAGSEHPVRGLAVSAEMYAADARIERAVLCALDRWMTEVTLWHDDWPLAVGSRTMPVQHLLSGAARAFKRHALAAAGIPGTVGPTESLLSDMKASLPVDSELIPVG